MAELPGLPIPDPMLDAYFTPWTAPLAGALSAVAVAMIAFRIGAAILARMAARSPSALEVLRRANRPASVLVPLVALLVSLVFCSDALPGVAQVRHVTAVVVIAVGAWLVTRCVAGLEAALVVARPATTADNLEARRLHTQMRVLARCVNVTVALVATAMILTTFQSVRQVGASLLASAGAAGIIAGLAARPVLGNLIAGLQIGLSQPIRLDDVVIVEGEWGRIEEITGSYVVVRLWDQRRLVVPLQWWIEHPFQNWTRRSAELLGSVYLWVDYRMPIEPLRAELRRICESSEHWDGRVCVLHVTEAGERGVQLRALVSSADSSRGWELRCEVRERLLAWMQREHAGCLPRARLELAGEGGPVRTPTGWAQAPARVARAG